MMAVHDDRRTAYGYVAPFVAGLIAERRPALTVLPFFDEMEQRVADGGADALLDMPADHWIEIGAIGTMDDAHAHVASLEQAGVGAVTIFPGPELEIAWEQMAGVAALAARLTSAFVVLGVALAGAHVVDRPRSRRQPQPRGPRWRQCRDRDRSRSSRTSAPSRPSARQATCLTHSV